MTGNPHYSATYQLPTSSAVYRETPHVARNPSSDNQERPLQSLPPFSHLLARVNAAQLALPGREDNSSPVPYDSSSLQQSLSTSSWSSKQHASRAQPLPSHAMNDEFDGWNREHAGYSHRYSNAASSEPSTPGLAAQRERHILYSSSHLPHCQADLFGHSRGHLHHDSTSPSPGAAAYGQPTHEEQQSLSDRYRSYSDSLMTPMSYAPTPDSQSTRGEESVQLSPDLRLVPGLCPSTSGRQQIVYEDTRRINGELLHVYSGGYYLPSVINGERVNTLWGLTKANTPRKRLSVACDRCRQKKTRCDPGADGCVQCGRANKTCQTSFAGQATPHCASPTQK